MEAELTYDFFTLPGLVEPFFERGLFALSIYCKGISTFRGLTGVFAGDLGLCCNFFVKTFVALTVAFEVALNGLCYESICDIEGVFLNDLLALSCCFSGTFYSKSSVLKLSFCFLISDDFSSGLSESADSARFCSSINYIVSFRVEDNDPI